MTDWAPWLVQYAIQLTTLVALIVLEVELHSRRTEQIEESHEGTPVLSDRRCECGHQLCMCGHCEIRHAGHPGCRDCECHGMVRPL